MQRKDLNKFSNCNSKDPSFASNTTDASASTCGSPLYKDDGYCDDDNNNEGLILKEHSVRYILI